MSLSTEPKGYCPYCEKDVHLRQEKMDPCIIVILIIFTAGFGLIPYYYMRKPNRCVICGAYCQSDLYVGPSAHKNGEIAGVKTFFCKFCGTELNRENQEFCPNCETKNS